MFYILKYVFTLIFNFALIIKTLPGHIFLLRPHSNTSGRTEKDRMYFWQVIFPARDAPRLFGPAFQALQTPKCMTPARDCELLTDGDPAARGPGAGAVTSALRGRPLWRPMAQPRKDTSSSSLVGRRRLAFLGGGVPDFFLESKKSCSPQKR